MVLPEVNRRTGLIVQENHLGGVGESRTGGVSRLQCIASFVKEKREARALETTSLELKYSPKEVLTKTMETP